MNSENVCHCFRRQEATPVPDNAVVIFMRKSLSFRPLIGIRDTISLPIVQRVEQFMGHHLEVKPLSPLTDSEFSEKVAAKKASLYYRNPMSKIARRMDTEAKQEPYKKEKGVHGISTKWALKHPHALFGKFYMVDYSNVGEEREHDERIIIDRRKKRVQ